jgi:hypothetical protein
MGEAVWLSEDDIYIIYFLVFYCHDIVIRPYTLVEDIHTYSDTHPRPNSLAFLQNAVNPNKGTDPWCRFCKE